jgi:outer membrane protein OmpA-like peptidoglycan-associated protein
VQRTSVIIAVASALLVLAACETAPDSSAVLEQARQAVAHAEADPNVSKYAPAELDRARKLLVNAEGTAREKGAKDESAAHYAYLTTQMARIAGQRAQEQVALRRIKAGETERQNLLQSDRENGPDQALAQTRAAQLVDMKASQTSRGILLTLNDVSFDTGTARLNSGAQRSIDQIVAFLNENPERRVQIEGFTDSEGTNDYNIELSQCRADAVAMAIIQRGIDAERVRALGYGERFPVASNASSASRQLNRRVEVILSNGDQLIPGRVVVGAT